VGSAGTGGCWHRERTSRTKRASLDAPDKTEYVAFNVVHAKECVLDEERRTEEKEKAENTPKGILRLGQHFNESWMNTAPEYRVPRRLHRLRGTRVPIDSKMRPFEACRREVGVEDDRNIG
jgi:hypothetical protein